MTVCFGNYIFAWSSRTLYFATFQYLDYTDVIKYIITNINLIENNIYNDCLINLFRFDNNGMWSARSVDPLTSSWPHLRCDVGLEEGEYK